MNNNSRWKIAIERIHTLKTAYSYTFTDTPEEDAWKKIRSWAEPKGLLTREKGTRIFGRNTYPTENPEPHGYELYITINEEVMPGDEIMLGEIHGGMYAILKSTMLEEMASAWPTLWKWIEDSEYEFTGWKKGEHGWANGYEEHLNPFDGKPPSQWLFNLMIPVNKK